MPHTKEKFSLDHEKLEAELRQTQHRLRHIVLSSPAVLFTLAISGEEIQGITWISENLRHILGYRPEIALGRDWFLTNLHPEDRDRIIADLHAVLSRGQLVHEYRLMHADGTYRWTRGEFRLIRDETGAPIEAVGALVDITERKRAEEVEAKLRAQLQQSQKLESVGRLAGGVAHDFNNLLTVINGYSALALEELAPGSPLHSNISEIRVAGERAAALTKQLLILSRTQLLQRTEVDLNGIITEVERMLGRVIGEDIHLISVLNPSLGRVLADPGQLHQVLMNLAVNARDAMPNGGTLLIETDNVELGASYTAQHPQLKPGPYVQLRVSDTGVGMNKEVMAKLFEPFFTTKRPGEGTGLGLATVYGIIKQSGGAISVYTEPGQGTAFTIYLPRLEQWTANLLEATTPTRLRGVETVLVVEDHEQLRKMTVLVLRQYGYRVLEAADAKQALLESERYADTIHLLLTDMIMPGSTGRELANRIKAARPLAKVLFMSGYSAPAMADRGLLEPAGNYIQKPFSPEALATKVREILGIPSSRATILIVADDPGIRHALRKLLTGVGYEVLGAQDEREAVDHFDLSGVDLAIVDPVTPQHDKQDQTGILQRCHPGIKVIPLTTPIQPDAFIQTVNSLSHKETE